MTRIQFSEICMAIMKVVSLSSLTVILPAYASVAKDSESSTCCPSTSTASAERYDLLNKVYAIYSCVWDVTDASTAFTLLHIGYPTVCHFMP